MSKMTDREIDTQMNRQTDKQWRIGTYKITQNSKGFQTLLTDK